MRLRLRSPLPSPSQALKDALLALGIAIALNMLLFLAMTRDMETLGLPALLSLFHLPLLAVFVGLRLTTVPPWLRHCAYWLLILLFEAWALAWIYPASQEPVSDGSLEMGIYTALLFFSGGAFAWVALFLRERNHPQK